MTELIHRALGLTDDELDSIVAILGRDPNHLELAMFSVMWSDTKDQRHPLEGRS